MQGVWPEKYVCFYHRRTVIFIHLQYVELYHIFQVARRGRYTGYLFLSSLSTILTTGSVMFFISLCEMCVLTIFKVQDFRSMLDDKLLQVNSF